MSRRAEEAALKVYPEKWFRDIDGDSYDCNRYERCAYQEGYEQAEKDTIERVCKWIEENRWEIPILRLCKAMEEE